MPLQPGERLGPYEVVSRIGEGGMGEVWKARDTRLDRTVALKISKAAFSDRFEREARAVAALNHPHICQIHDIGPNFLVMEYVEGKPVEGPMPVEKAVEHALLILDALAAAHAKRIVHRDLKPANILLTKGGVKLLDFGLAKQSGPLGDHEATRTEVLTGQGQIVGTLQYMAPEQLQGQEADARSDLFAFGCVLYEMVSGRRAFSGQSAASVIAAIMEREPEPLQVAAPLGRVIRTCLEKDPDKRFQSAIDLKRGLQWAMEQPAAGATAVATRKKAWLPWAVAAGAVVLAAAVWTLRPEPSGLPRGKNMRISRDGTSSMPRLSPDGNFVVYTSTRTGDMEIYVQQINGDGMVRITDSPGMDAWPVFSPDGSKIYFTSYRAPRGVYEAPALGGPARLVAAGGQGAAPSPDGKWLAYSDGDSIWLRPLPAGEARRLVQGFAAPVWSPDSTSLLLRGPRGENYGLAEVALDGTIRSRIGWMENLRARGMYDATYSVLLGWGRSGDLYFSAPSGDAVNVWKLPFERAADGEPVPITLGTPVEVPGADLRAGRLVYAAGNNVMSQWFLPADLDAGRVLGSFRRLSNEQVNAFHQDISPDGRHVVYAARKGAAVGVWIVDVETGKERLVLQAANQRDTYSHFQFSPDGKRIATHFAKYVGASPANPSATGVIDVESGELRKIASSAGRIRGWTPDGRLLIVWRYDPPARIEALDVNTGQGTEILRAERIQQPRLSADGKWIAFLAASGLFVAPFRGAERIPEAQWTRIAARAAWPFWSPNGRNLYYVTGDANIFARASAGILMRQGFDPATGAAQGPPAEFLKMEDRLLGNPVTNQLIGGKSGIAAGLMTLSSDVWAIDVGQ